jgi:hypothetical protein
MKNVLPENPKGESSSCQGLHSKEEEEEKGWGVEEENVWGEFGTCLSCRITLFSACFLLLIFGDTMVWCKLLLYFDILFRSIFARVKVGIFLMQIQFFGWLKII